MAPKPTAKPVAAGKKPTGAISAKGKPDAKTPSSGDAGAAGDESPTTMAAPKNKEEVLAQVNLDGLPNCPTDAIVEILRGKYETLVSIFINYCKHSDCKTLELSTRLRLGTRCPPPPTGKRGAQGRVGRFGSSGVEPVHPQRCVCRSRSLSEEGCPALPRRLSAAAAPATLCSSRAPSRSRMPSAPAQVDSRSSSRTPVWS